MDCLMWCLFEKVRTHFAENPNEWNGNNADEVLRKLFSGKRITQNFGWFLFSEFGCRKRRRKIRYEKKSSISVDCFVFQHHPNNVHHLTSEADKGLALWFALTNLSFEVCLGHVITHAWYLRERHAMESTVKSPVTRSCLLMSLRLSGRTFPRSASGILRKCSRRMEASNVTDLSDNHSCNGNAATWSGLDSVAFIKESLHFFFQINR